MEGLGRRLRVVGVSAVVGRSRSAAAAVGVLQSFGYHVVLVTMVVECGWSCSWRMLVDNRGARAQFFRVFSIYWCLFWQGSLLHCLQSEELEVWSF